MSYPLAGGTGMREIIPYKGQGGDMKFLGTTLLGKDLSGCHLKVGRSVPKH